jgi:hypothetical protein
MKRAAEISMANVFVDLNIVDRTLMTAELEDRWCQDLKDFVADHVTGGKNDNSNKLLDLHFKVIEVVERKDKNGKHLLLASNKICVLSISLKREIPVQCGNILRGLLKLSQLPLLPKTMSGQGITHYECCFHVLLMIYSLTHTQMLILLLGFYTFSGIKMIIVTPINLEICLVVFHCKATQKFLHPIFILRER